MSHEDTEREGIVQLAMFDYRRVNGFKLSNISTKTIIYLTENYWSITMWGVCSILPIQGLRGRDEWSQLVMSISYFSGGPVGSN